MTSLTDLNSNNKNNEIAYNYCAGKDCKNTPTHFLKLVLLKRRGYFCDSCVKYLQQNGLIESILYGGITEKGDVNNIGR